MSFIVGGKEYETYQDFLKENLNIFEKIEGVFTGRDDRLDFLNATMLRVEALLAAAEPPTVEIEVPGFPEIKIPDPLVLLSDSVLVNITLDMRRFLIMMYRLGRAYETRLFDYIELGPNETDSFLYSVPSDYVYIPHIEHASYGIQRVITRRDYEGGDLKNTEQYAIDMTIEWGMTPLSKITTGSFEVSFENPGFTETWVKSRFIGTLLAQSDYLWWRRAVRTLGDRYMGLLPT